MVTQPDNEARKRCKIHVILRETRRRGSQKSKFKRRVTSHHRSPGERVLQQKSSFIGRVAAQVILWAGCDDMFSHRLVLWSSSWSSSDAGRLQGHKNVITCIFPTCPSLLQFIPYYVLLQTSENVKRIVKNDTTGLKNNRTLLKGEQSSPAERTGRQRDRRNELKNQYYKYFK